MGACTSKEEGTSKSYSKNSVVPSSGVQPRTSSATNGSGTPLDELSNCCSSVQGDKKSLDASAGRLKELQPRLQAFLQSHEVKKTSLHAAAGAWSVHAANGMYCRHCPLSPPPPTLCRGMWRMHRPPVGPSGSSSRAPAEPAWGQLNSRAHLAWQGRPPLGHSRGSPGCRGSAWRLQDGLPQHSTGQRSHCSRISSSPGHVAPTPACRSSRHLDAAPVPSLLRAGSQPACIHAGRGLLPQNYTRVTGAHIAQDPPVLCILL